jgi:hypothetical protein
VHEIARKLRNLGVEMLLVPILARPRTMPPNGGSYLEVYASEYS